MKTGVLSFSLLALVAAPVVAWADANPDFDDDAKPILNAQPGLVHYVESRFEVKDTGTAKYPGDDERRPVPPYIFRARPIGSNGPFNLRLLIQPGPPGHILGVVDITKAHINEPGSAPTQPPSYAHQAPPAPAPTYQSPTLSQAPATPSPAQTPPPTTGSAPSSDTPSGPTADTPSGPIRDSGSSASGQPNLTPPPDPAPPAQ
jgi:hypothetical protein